MKKILIFTSSEGHLSIATAIYQVLKQTSFSPVLTNLLTKKAFNVYLPFYRYLPSLFKIPYKMGEKDAIQKGVKTITERIFEKEAKNEFKKFAPDLIICTNFSYITAINKVLDYQKIAIPFINIITNPWAIHPLELSPHANYNLVYDNKSQKLSKKHISGDKIFPTGWFVRHQFYHSYNSKNTKKKLGFSNNIFTLLVCGGSEGTNMILKILPSLLTIKKPVQVIAVCGTNKTLYKALISFKKLLPKLSKTKINSLKTTAANIKLKVLKFTNKLPEYINACDLVAGKAGPNLIFETVAQKKPFLAICHISGQEDANLDLIRKKHLGFVEESPLKAVKLLQKIINNPKILDKFTASLQKERQYNLEAPDKLIKIISQLMERV